MSIVRRTSKEIESDFIRIQEAAKKAKSIAEISKITTLTYQQITTSLNKHPRLSKKIKEQLDFNLNNTCFVETEEIKAVDTRVTHTIHTKRNTTAPEKRYVIDASITGTEELASTLDRIFAGHDKIILTHITISELAKIQRFNTDSLARHDARRILDICASFPERVECVQIDESPRIRDNCIIKYCRENNNNLILLTGDKEMALVARSYGIETRYFKKVQKRFVSAKNVEKKNIQNASSTVNLNHQKYSEVSKITTSQPSKRSFVESTIRYNGKNWNVDTMVHGKLCINNFHDDFTSIRVLSNGKEYDEGPCELRVDDEVLIATKRGTLIDFKVFKITSLSNEDNCQLIFVKGITSKKHIPLNNYKYNDFISYFKNRHFL